MNFTHGNAHQFAARELRPRTPIAGLYLTGADIVTAGVGGALMGGVLTASVITRRNLVGAILADDTARPAVRRAASADLHGIGRSAFRDRPLPAMKA